MSSTRYLGVPRGHICPPVGRARVEAAVWMPVWKEWLNCVLSAVEFAGRFVLKVVISNPYW